MLPRLGSSKLVTTWILVTLGVSIVAAIDGGWVASWAALAPARIWRGEVWRLVTWPLVEAGPMSLVLTCAAIYKFGGELAVRWGDRRLRRFMATVLVGAAVLTSLVALVTHAWYLARVGGWATIDVLVIAWARQFPDRTLVLYYGMLRLRGKQVVQVTLGVALLFAIYYGPLAVLPEVFACAGAAAYPKSWLRRS